MSGLNGSWLSNPEINEIIVDVQRMLDRDSWQAHTEASCPCGHRASFHCNDCVLPELCKDCMVAAHQGSAFHIVTRKTVLGEELGDLDCPCGNVADFCCNHCFGPPRCMECIDGAHQNLPFHAILEWSERAKYYTLASLRDMGLRIAFGHDGATCPQLRPDRLEAITTRGIVTVNVDFCACVDATSDEEQIKAHGWQFPFRPIAMSLSKGSPGSTPEYPLVLDARGHLVEVEQVPQAATSTRAASASTSRAVATNPPSPEVQITGFRRIRVRLPASPEFISTGHHFRRPQLVSPSTIRCRLPFPVLSSPPRAPPIRHSIRKYGARVRQVPPVTRENLLQGDGLRPAYNVLEEHHRCGLCSGVKIHPRIDNFGLFPATCADIAIAIHWGEEAALRSAYPGLGLTTRVDYSWNGLQFPEKPGVVFPQTP
ncbi:hypothetical protein B0H14DRAFT_2613608 [Mycena olivaceomarginata]|nr:hypothetical protein B0H14DRAFT_2613608 [Mycena olivaceomarginata]